MAISFGARLASNARSQIPALRIILLSLGLVLTGPLAVAQQVSGAIAGTVKDPSGAVLPGVTVVASSPALIEKSRTGTTDANGAYRIVDLQPGTYSVMFTLAGFQTVTQEGIEITQGFTANVNPALSVGAVSQQVTVTSASPLIDVQSTTQTDTISRAELTQVPSSENYAAVAELIPGAGPSAGSQDVGGTVFAAALQMHIHGGTGSDTAVTVDGLDISELSSSGGGSVGAVPPEGEIQSINIQVGNEPADVESDGTVTNIIPKTGGDQFHGGVYFNYANGDLQSSNLTPYLRSLGLTTTSSVTILDSIEPYIGGPLLKGKVWVFMAGNRTVAASLVPNSYLNASTNPFIYIPDLNKPGLNNHHVDGGNVRFTWQVNPENTVGFYYSDLQLCDCHLGLSGTESPEVAPRIVQRYPRDLQATWTSILSPKLLFKFGWGQEATLPYHISVNGSAQGQSNVPVTDSALGFSWGGPQNALNNYYRYDAYNNVFNGFLAYNTAEQSIQFGAQFKYKLIDSYMDPMLLGPATYTLTNGVSTSVTIYPGPTAYSDHVLPDLGIYGEDKWTIKKRLTVLPGLRWDMLRTAYNAATDPVSSYTSAQISTPCCRPQAYSAPAATVLNWKDIDPRFGAVYDLLGNGKTALKVNLGRYPVFTELYGAGTSLGGGLSQAAVSVYNLVPTIASQASETRTWNQPTPDLGMTGANPLNPAPNGGPNCNTTTGANCILGKSSNSTFGTPIIPLALTIDPSFAHGFDVRPYQWEFSAGVQQQIIPGVAFTANFTRRSYGNILVTNNLAANSASDYSPYCVTAPVDSRLPHGGGYQICGLYDLNPAYFGLPTDTVYDSAGQFGGETAIWRGYDFLIDAHVHNILLNGGLDTGTDITNDCALVARIGNTNTSNQVSALGNPSPLYCSIKTPYLSSFRMNGVYPLPKNFAVSAAFQTNPGPFITAAAVFSNAQIAPSLGRNLSEGSTATATVPLVAPGTMFGPRANQLDLRFAKKFTIKEKFHVEGDFDLYNSLNAAPALTLNNTYGTSGAKWLQPAILLPPRLAKFGIRAEF